MFFFFEMGKKKKMEKRKLRGFSCEKKSKLNSVTDKKKKKKNAYKTTKLSYHDPIMLLCNTIDKIY